MSVGSSLIFQDFTLSVFHKHNDYRTFFKLTEPQTSTQLSALLFLSQVWRLDSQQSLIFLYSCIENVNKTHAVLHSHWKNTFKIYSLWESWEEATGTVYFLGVSGSPQLQTDGPSNQHRG